MALVVIGFWVVCAMVLHVPLQVMLLGSWREGWWGLVLATGLCLLGMWVSVGWTVGQMVLHEWEVSGMLLPLVGAILLGLRFDVDKER